MARFNFKKDKYNHLFVHHSSHLMYCASEKMVTKNIIQTQGAAS